MEARLNANQILLPIGTVISFRMIGKNKRINAVKLINSDEVSKFFAIFSENDVDFEIEVNNSECIYGIGYTLTINNGYYDYYVGPRETWTMETLYSKGRKLHFISQKSEEGEQIVAETATKHEMSYDEAAAACSKIEFNFEVEKGAENPVKKPVLSKLSRRLASEVYEDVAVDSLSAKSMSFGSSLPMSRSYRGGGFGASNSLSRNIAVNAPNMFSSSITAQSESTSSLGRLTPPPESLFVCPPPPTQSHLARPIPTPVAPVATSTQVAFEAKQDDNRDKREAQNLGEKGVICFGDQSDQIYNNFGAFVKDKNLFIKPFIVEMRISV